MLNDAIRNKGQLRVMRNYGRWNSLVGQKVEEKVVELKGNYDEFRLLQEVN
jgi:hypothetical protein